MDSQRSLHHNIKSLKDVISTQYKGGMFWQQIGPGYKLVICDYCGKFEHFVNDCPGCEKNICKSNEDLIKSGNIIMQTILKPS
jgi:hypothetical protein